MRTRLKIDFGLTLLTIVLALPFSASAVQEDLPDPDAQVYNTVEIDYPPEYLLPFRERRPEWSPLFSMKYETFTPKKYKSPDPDGASYTGIFGAKSAQMFGPQGGVKRNFDWGALVAEASWQTGKVSDLAEAGAVDATLEMTKMAGHFGIWLDTLWPDPYLVPYIQGDYASIDFKETSVWASGNANYSGTSTAFGYTGGVLVLLNWMDEASSFQNLKDAGINNTYVDLFLTKTVGSGERDFSNDWDWGAALKMEF